MTQALAAMQRELMHISRDALAGVLGVTGERGTRIEGIRCIDLRRHDERALYGSIPGAERSAPATCTRLSSACRCCASQGLHVSMQNML